MAVLHSIKLQITAITSFFFFFSPSTELWDPDVLDKKHYVKPKYMPQQVTITTNHTVFKDMYLKKSKQNPWEPPCSTTVFLQRLLFWQVYSFKIYTLHIYMVYYLETENKEEKHNCLSTDGCSNIIVMKCLRGRSTSFPAHRGVRHPSAFSKVNKHAFNTASTAC